MGAWCHQGTPVQGTKEHQDSFFMCFVFSVGFILYLREFRGQTQKNEALIALWQSIMNLLLELPLGNMFFKVLFNKIAVL
jgi:hypothetical protein